MANVYKEQAHKYTALGLSPLPLKPGEKRPILSNWQKWCKEPVDEATRKQWESQHGGCGLGLALGTEVAPGMHLIAFDIDDGDMVVRVEKALGAREPSKAGKKGKTIFALAAPKQAENRKLRRQGAMTPGVELLGVGSQTVMPPSIHPDTGRPYTWGGISIFDRPLGELPVVTEWTLDEIQAHYADRGEKIDALNNMVWLGVGGGGNTHDACVSAVASLVSRDWPDSAILERVKRAKKEACEKAGETYHWPQADHTIQEWIASARAKGMEGKTKKKQEPPERVMARWLLDHFGGAAELWARQGQLHQYQDGHWPVIPDSLVRRLAYAQDQYLKRHEAENAVKILYDEVVDSNKRDDAPSAPMICMSNGTLDLRTGRLEQWDPGHRLLHQLPLDWDETARCPRYDKFVSWVFEGRQQDIDLWDEFAAHTLVDEMKFQKVLFLVGGGNNGKSTLTRILTGLHGPGAVASIPITELADERKRSSLVGKLVNISSEESRLSRMADAELKRITGQDGVNIRFLYKEVKNDVRLSVRFIETVNTMPGTNDVGHALARRLVILDCNQRVPDDQVDQDLANNILAQESTGILARWVAALRRLYARKQFDLSHNAKERVAEYLLTNDTVQLWVRERCELWPKGTVTGELWSDFQNWERTTGLGRYGLNMLQWAERLTQLGYDGKVRKVGGRSVRMRNIRVKPGLEGPS